MKYRPHRGSLADSMQEVVEFENKDDLYKHIRLEWDGEITSDFYCYDRRTHWDTYIVKVDGHPVGWTDSPLK